MVKSDAANSAAGKPARSGRAAAAGVPTNVMVAPVIPAIRKRFETACARFGLNVGKTKLTTEHFRPPRRAGEQLSLFQLSLS
jgi:hypothetical protein